MTNQWIYILSKKLDKDSASIFLSTLKNFLLSWDSHGSLISSEAYLFLEQVVVVNMSDSSTTSGCSISTLRSQVADCAKLNNCNILSSNFVTLIENSEIHFLERKNIKDYLKARKDFSTLRVLDQNLTFCAEMGIESITTPIENSWLFH